LTLPTSTEEAKAQSAKWAEEIKYHAARSIWHKRTQRVPSRRYSWGKWFEVKFGEPYMEYVERMKGQKNQKG
jgi:hypothetical protein